MRLFVLLSAGLFYVRRRLALVVVVDETHVELFAFYFSLFKPHEVMPMTYLYVYKHEPAAQQMMRVCVWGCEWWWLAWMLCTVHWLYVRRLLFLCSRRDISIICTSDVRPFIHKHSTRYMKVSICVLMDDVRARTLFFRFRIIVSNVRSSLWRSYVGLKLLLSGGDSITVLSVEMVF